MNQLQVGIGGSMHSSFIFYFFLTGMYAAEDWLKPTTILEAFEARAIRMAVTCSKNLSNFSNPEEGNSTYVDLVVYMIVHLNCLQLR